MVVNALPVNTPELYILGMGHFHPENLIDNGFLESLDIGTNDEWITERTGIKTRRTVLNLDYIRETSFAHLHNLFLIGFRMHRL